MFRNSNQRTLSEKNSRKNRLGKLRLLQASSVIDRSYATLTAATGSLGTFGRRSTRWLDRIIASIPFLRGASRLVWDQLASPSSEPKDTRLRLGR